MELECTHDSEDTRAYRVLVDRPLFTHFDGLCCAVLAVLGAVQVFSGLVFHAGTIFLLITAIVVAFRLLFKMNQATEERVLVIRGLGVQLTTVYASGSTMHRFVEQKRLRDIVINEGFSLFKVLFYLAFVVEGEQDMLLAFPSLFPRLPILLKVFHGLRHVVFEEPE